MIIINPHRAQSRGARGPRQGPGQVRRVVAALTHYSNYYYLFIIFVSSSSSSRSKNSNSSISVISNNIIIIIIIKRPVRAVFVPSRSAGWWILGRIFSEDKRVCGEVCPTFIRNLLLSLRIGGEHQEETASICFHIRCIGERLVSCRFLLLLSLRKFSENPNLKLPFVSFRVRFLPVISRCRQLRREKKNESSTAYRRRMISDVRACEAGEPRA